MNVTDINDHKAYSCKCCGSVTFWLLKSGRIQCASCNEFINKCEWSEMDENYIPKSENEKEVITREQIHKAKQIITDAIKNSCSCYWSTIIKQNNDSVPSDAVSKALNEMLKEGIIRQREDMQEHDWEYSFK